MPELVSQSDPEKSDGPQSVPATAVGCQRPQAALTRRILVVEDDEAHAELIRLAFLSRGSSDDLVCVQSLRAGQQELRDNPPNIILSDIRLPDGEGLDLISRPAGEEAAFPLVQLKFI